MAKYRPLSPEQELEMERAMSGQTYQGYQRSEMLRKELEMEQVDLVGNLRSKLARTELSRRVLLSALTDLSEVLNLAGILAIEAVIAESEAILKGVE